MDSNNNQGGGMNTGSIVGGLVQGGLGLVGSWLSNKWARENAREARAENYRYNEMAAQNADERTRALYSDLYSPAARLAQIREAGLSPSLMYGGSGQGGATPQGAQGGAGMAQAQTFGLDPMMAAQIRLMNAQANKTNAETTNVEEDTKIKEIQKQLQEMQTNLYSLEFDVATTFIDNEDGTKTSLYEYAKNFKEFDEFLASLKKLNNAPAALDSKNGVEILQEIWKSSKKLDTQLSILTADKVNADFQVKVLNAMSSHDFAELNAKAATEQLKAIAQESELTEQQKKAWNELLNKMEDGTTKNIIIVLGMLINNMASNWRPMPNVSITRSTSQGSYTK